MDPGLHSEAVAAIGSQAERLERLLTNLLDVARIENDGIVSDDQPVDVSASVAKVVAEFRSAAPDRAIVLAVPIECWALGDELHMEQIVSNVVSNAIKYAPAPEPVEIEVRETGGWVEVRIADHGPGIPAADAERVFERFRRLGDHMTRSTGGVGLGLYIARRFAESMGGTLTVSTTPRGGATFSLRLRPAGGAPAAGEGSVEATGSGMSPAGRSG
jgi:two-component system sensor histidine kinase KdpD